MSPTHGSLAKAAKTRAKSPSIWERETFSSRRKCKVKYHGRLMKNRKTPLRNNRRKYNQLLNKLQRNNLF